MSQGLQASALIRLDGVYGLRYFHHAAASTHSGQGALTSVLVVCGHIFCDHGGNDLHCEKRMMALMFVFSKPCFMQIIQVVSLHLLFAATAFLAAGCEVGTLRPGRIQSSHQHASPLDAFAALWHGSQVWLTAHILVGLSVTC